MKQVVNEIVERIVAELDVDVGELALRKRYLGLEQRDIELLRLLHGRLGFARRRVVDGFYAHFQDFEATRNLLADPVVLERLKGKQAEYFDSLTEGDYDQAYARERLRVGAVHQHVGLEPKWYLGAYCQYLTSLLPEVWRALPDDPEQALAAYQALLKVVFLDLGLALDTYIHADRATILVLKEYAESIVCSVPTGLMVLGADLRVQFCNRAMDAIFAVHHDQLRGLRLDDAIPALGLHARAQEVLRTGQPQHGIDVRLERPRGRKYLQIAITLLRPGDGAVQKHAASPAQLLVVVEDITETTQLRAATLESDARIRAIMNHVPDGIITIDESGSIESWNCAAEQIFGYRAAEAIGQHVRLLMPEPYRSEFDAYLSNYLRAGQGKCLGIGIREVLGRRKDGTVFSMDLTTSGMCIDGRRLFIGIVRDISERKQALEQMHKLSGAIEQTADSVVITDVDGVIEYVNPAFEKCTGYSSDEALGRKPNLVKSGQHSDTFYKRLWKSILKGDVYRGVFINRSKRGEVYYEEKTITPLRDAQGTITHFVSTGKDVTERMRAQERLDYLAHHDALTELPNRILFMDRLGLALARATRQKHSMAVLFLDLDRFKFINDTLGHDAGDMLLRAVSQRILNRIRTVDSVARLGGDEFAILCEDISGAEAVPIIAQEVLAALHDPFMLNGREVHITTSIGISLFPDDGTDAQTLLKHADTAMYRAKAQGKNTYCFFTIEMNAKALDLLNMENELRHALEREEFVLHYQPQVDIRSGRILGVEALLRWNHPRMGLVSPLEFIPLLEDSGQIVPVGEWVLCTALAQLHAWRGAGSCNGLRMAVNVSPRQVRQPDMVALVGRAVDSIPLPDAQGLELEITESLLMENVPETIVKLTALRDMGVRLSLDDFGTGYSSLAYLKRFPISTVKIDRSFVRDIPADPDSAAIVSAVIAMAHSLKLDVIAEGVESEEQLAFLRQRDCDAMQGYLFSKPLPAEQLNDLLGGAVPARDR